MNRPDNPPATAHTPGPWEAERLPAEARENERGWVGRLAERRYAALSCGETQAEAAANARLIAAAPDLLAALELITNVACSTPGFPSKMAIEDARAAIAKARGTEA